MIFSSSSLLDDWLYLSKERKEESHDEPELAVELLGSTAPDTLTRFFSFFSTSSSEVLRARGLTGLELNAGELMPVGLSDGEKDISLSIAMILRLQRESEKASNIAFFLFIVKLSFCLGET